MADFRPVEATKGRILFIHPAPVGTSLDDANAEWIEIQVDLDSDMANWRVQHLRPLWKEAPGRKHVYTAGPVANARLMWNVGDYARLLDAFGTVIDEVVVWMGVHPEPAAAAKEPTRT